MHIYPLNLPQVFTDGVLVVTIYKETIENQLTYLEDGLRAREVGRDSLPAEKQRIQEQEEGRHSTE